MFTWSQVICFINHLATFTSCIIGLYVCNLLTIHVNWHFTMIWIHCRYGISLSSIETVSHACIFFIGPPGCTTNTFRFIIPDCISFIGCCIWMVVQSKRITICFFDTAWCLINREVCQNRGCLWIRDSHTNLLCFYRLTLNKTTITNSRTLSIRNPATIELNFNLKSWDTLTFSDIFFEFDYVKASLLTKIDCKFTCLRIIWQCPASIILTIC